MAIRVTGPREPQPPAREMVIDTTSRSTTWSRGLSPFILGPVQLWGGYVSLTVENAWQYSKVYPRHCGQGGWPTAAWLDWARRGWRAPKASRYPMGKGAVPNYSYWQLEQDPSLGEYRQQLDYVPARKQIYIPLYIQAVQHTQALARLMRVYMQV